MEVRIERLESLYNALERLIGSNSLHIGTAKDSINACNMLVKGVETTLTKKIADVGTKAEDSIKDFANTIKGNSTTISELGIALEQRVVALESKVVEKQGSYMDRTDSLLRAFSERLQGIAKDVNGYKNTIDEAQGEFTSALGKRVKEIEHTINTTHKEYIDKEIADFKELYIINLNKLNSDIVDIKAYIVSAKSDQNYIRDYNEKDRESIYSAVNARLNTFIDDINDKLAVKNGNPKAVLKRIAHLEGVKDAVEHRKSAREVLDELHKSQIELLKSEVKGSLNKEALNRMNTLNWVLGRE